MCDVVGIGNALLDIVIEVDNTTLRELHLTKGKMHLIDKEMSGRIRSRLEKKPITMVPGGCAANTIAGLASIGGSSALFGRVGADPFGETYERETRAAGVTTILARETLAMTGHAIALITPDGERTFATHLGAANHFSKADVSEQRIADAEILHLEGYQLGDERLRETMLHAATLAHKHKTRVSIDVGDAAFITHHHAVFLSFIKEHADIVFMNEHEAHALTGKEEDESLAEIRKHCSLAVLKLGERGSKIYGAAPLTIPVTRTIVVNTNGAGDMYAAGILFGLVQKMSLEHAGRIASFAAARVVASPGARLERSIKDEIANLR